MDFMLLGYPRSATTWLANLFTTERTHCLHDPIEEYPLHILETMEEPGKLLGIACTGAWAATKWVNAQPCRKIVIERDIAECNASLAEVHLPPMEPEFTAKLALVDAPRVQFGAIWSEASMATIWGYLLPDVPFDVVRYRLLRKFAIQPQFEALTVKPEVMRDYVRRATGG